jgi:hypothetical protein
MVGSGAHAEELPVGDLPGSELRGNHLPLEGTRVFIKGHHDTAVSDVGLVARRLVVRANVHNAARDIRSAVRLGAQLRHPSDVLGRREVDSLHCQLFSCLVQYRSAGLFPRRPCCDHRVPPQVGQSAALAVEVPKFPAGRREQRECAAEQRGEFEGCFHGSVSKEISSAGK